MDIDGARNRFMNFKESEERREFGIISVLTKEEFQQYVDLKQRLTNLGRKKEKEALLLFLKVLDIIGAEADQKTDIDKK